MSAVGPPKARFAGANEIRRGQGARIFLTAALLALAGGLAGAAEPGPGAPGAAAAPEQPAAGSDAEFFAELGYKDVASAADTARAMVILVSEGQELGGEYVMDKKYLRDRGLTQGWLEAAAADDPTDKGHLAALLCRALGIKGGLWMRLLGPVPRYALRECLYLGLMTRGAEYEHVTGGELVGVIERADRFRLRQAGREAPELAGEPSGARAAVVAAPNPASGGQEVPR